MLPNNKTNETANDGFNIYSYLYAIMIIIAL